MTKITKFPEYLDPNSMEYRGKFLKQKFSKVYENIYQQKDTFYQLSNALYLLNNYVYFLSYCIITDTMGVLANIFQGGGRQFSRLPRKLPNLFCN